MATQDYNTISQPGFGVEPRLLGLVVKKDQKKQRKELAHLATVLRAVELELASAKSSASPGPSAPSNGSLEDVLAQMAGALQHLQVEIAKYAQDTSNNEATISRAELKVANDNLEKTIKALDKLARRAKTQKTFAFWEKFGEGLVGAVMVVVAAVTVQPELILAAALCFAGAFGLLSKASNGVASLLEDVGCSKDLANILGGILVTVIVIGATAGIASLPGVEVGTVAISDVVAEEAEAGIAQGLNTIGESDSFISKAGQVLKKINVFRKLSARANLMIMSGIQSGSQIGIITGITGAIAYELAGKSDEKEAKKIKQEVEMITGIIVAVMSLVATAGSGAALAEGANAVSETAGLAKDASLIRRIVAGFREIGRSSTGQRILQGINALASLEIAAAGITAGSYQISQGVLEKKLAQVKGDTTLNNTAIEMNNNVMSSSQQFIAQREKEFNTSNREIARLAEGEKAMAELLCSSMV